MAQAFRIRQLDGDAAAAAAAALGAVLHDCVAGGASVSFMADLTTERAAEFWRGEAKAARADGRAILVAEDYSGIVGVVQVIPAWQDNQPHRAELAKMLVHRRARRRGVAAALLRAAEDVAQAMGRDVLTLDTVPDGDAAHLYTRLGWTAAGPIPDYALWPDGRRCPTTLFYKRLPRG